MDHGIPCRCHTTAPLWYSRCDSLAPTQRVPHDCRGQIPIEVGKPWIATELDKAEVGEPIREHLQFPHNIDHGCRSGPDECRDKVRRADGHASISYPVHLDDVALLIIVQLQHD